MKKNSFSIIDEAGNEVVYDVLFTFENDETNKNYIVYTDNTKDEVGNIQVFASIYDPENSKVFSLQFRHLLVCACVCGGCSNACQTVAAPASRPSRRCLSSLVA